MGLLDRAIKKGLSNAVGNAIAESVKTVVQPKVDAAAANLANKAAQHINAATGEATSAAGEVNAAAAQVNKEEAAQALGALGELFGSFQSAAVGMANEAAKNMKTCPSCGEATTADKTFCPSCGARLPEETIAQGALCPSCGTQNEIGTKFCASCGAKLPATLAAETAFEADWDRLLPFYPKWRFGGTDARIEQNGTDAQGNPYYDFFVRSVDSAALKQYKDYLRENGFRKPVRYLSDEELYKVVDGVSYSVNSSEPFPADPGCLALTFHICEFDETPVERKAAAPQLDLGDLKKLFKL